jgi:protein-L-isoaspartate(D-aspartate) O-methyltransferase
VTDDPDFAAERERMVERLERRHGVRDEATLDALRSVPRHEFVPDSQRVHAYEDRPLPIAAGQTISAPHMVAMMSGLMSVDRGDAVLEIGTGCGYHAAVTAEIVGPGNVYSVEYEPELAARARDRFERLGYDVDVRVGDGREGWPEHAPYDAAYFTCAPEEIPASVVEQVRPGGVAVGPVGVQRQRLLRLRRRADGTVEREDHGGVRFVPMQGQG